MRCERCGAAVFPAVDVVTGRLFYADAAARTRLIAVDRDDPDLTLAEHARDDYPLTVRLERRRTYLDHAATCGRPGGRL